MPSAVNGTHYYFPGIRKLFPQCGGLAAARTSMRDSRPLQFKNPATAPQASLVRLLFVVALEFRGVREVHSDGENDVSVGGSSELEGGSPSVQVAIEGE